MREIVPNVFTFKRLPVGRVYLLRDEGPDGDELTLIDASVASAGGSILKQIQAGGLDPKRLRRILVTHAHPDHVGAIPLLVQETGAEVWLSEAESEVLDGERPVAVPPRDELRGLARWVRLPHTVYRGMKTDRVLEPDQHLGEVLGGLRVVATPGHAPGHLSFFQPERRILFTGDTVFHFASMTLPFSFFTVNMAENIRSIRRLAELEPSVVCFGHGRPLVRDSAQRLRRFAEKLPG